MFRPFNLYWFYPVSVYNELQRTWSSSKCNFPQPPTSSSFLHPNVLLSTLLPNTSVYALVSDFVSHPHSYEASRKVKILHISFYTSLLTNVWQKFLNRIMQEFRKFNQLLIFLNAVLICHFLPKILNCITCSKSYFIHAVAVLLYTFLRRLRLSPQISNSAVSEATCAELLDVLLFKLYH